MRTDIIHRNLEQHFHEVGSAACRVDQKHYADLPVTPTKRMGIYGPLDYPQPGVERKDTDPPVMMVWCPEYIDILTGDLSDVELEKFLEILCYVGDMMIALMDEIVNVDDRFRAIEDRFIEKWPESLSLMSRMELKAIDLEMA